MRSWTFNYLTLDGLKAESFETLPEHIDPPLELRRPTTASGKKIPLISILNGEVSMAGTHRLYERRSFSQTSRTANYFELDPSAVRTIVESETFRKNNGAGGPSRERIRRKGE